MQVRINGRVATIEQVKALLPETIKRVEWIDNPGLRYNGANYVLNFIVTNPTLGGSLMLEGKQAVNEKWGYYRADTKFNIGRSQWVVGAYFKLTDNVKSHREYEETFTYPDGTSLTRTETPIGGELDNSQGAMWLTYNYIKPDTTVFYVALQANRNFADKWLYNGVLTVATVLTAISAQLRLSQRILSSTLAINRRWLWTSVRHFIPGTHIQIILSICRLPLSL